TASGSPIQADRWRAAAEADGKYPSRQLVAPSLHHRVTSDGIAGALVVRLVALLDGARGVHHDVDRDLASLRERGERGRGRDALTWRDRAIDGHLVQEHAALARIASVVADDDLGGWCGAVVVDRGGYRRRRAAAGRTELDPQVGQGFGRVHGLFELVVVFVALALGVLAVDHRPHAVRQRAGAAARDVVGHGEHHRGARFEAVLNRGGERHRAIRVRVQWLVEGRIEPDAVERDLDARAHAQVT